MHAYGWFRLDELPFPHAACGKRRKFQQDILTRWSITSGPGFSYPVALVRSWALQTESIAV